MNSGLSIYFNKKEYYSNNGLKDLLIKNTENQKICYPIIHLKSDDIEVALTHGNRYGEEYYAFVNGQNTTQGGTHLAAFKEALVKTLRDYYKKNFDSSDIRASIIASFSIRIQNPIFESQTKTKLGSTDMGGDLPTVRTYINDFLKRNLDNYLHRNPETAEKLQRKIVVAFFVEHHAVLQAAATALLDKQSQRFIRVFGFLRPDDSYLFGSILGDGQQ